MFKSERDLISHLKKLGVPWYVSVFVIVLGYVLPTLAIWAIFFPGASYLDSLPFSIWVVVVGVTGNWLYRKLFRPAEKRSNDDVR